MDPISAIGVLASLSSLIKASDTLLGVAKSIRNAEKELRELYNDLAIFQEALKGFDRVLRSRQTRHNISGEVIHNAVQEASATIEDLENRLGQIISSNVSSLRSLRWAQHKSSLKKVHERLREQSTMLQSFLALAHAFVILLFIECYYTLVRSKLICGIYRETFFAVCSEYPQLLQVYSNSTVPEDTETLSIQESTTSDSSTLFSNSSASSLRRPSVDTTASSIESSSSLSVQSLSIADTSAPNAPGKGDAGREQIETQMGPVKPCATPYFASLPLVRVVDAESESKGDGKGLATPGSMLLPTTRRSCRYDCYCKCHDSVTSPRSRASKVPCSEPSCIGEKAAKGKGFSTSIVFLRAISQVISSRSTKVPYSLNTFRMVPEGFDAIRYVKHGNLDKLKVCFETGEATLWDTAPDGWSLLHASTLLPLC